MRCIESVDAKIILEIPPVSDAGRDGQFADFQILLCYGALGIGSCRIIFIAVFIIYRNFETSNFKNFIRKTL